MQKEQPLLRPVFSHACWHSHELAAHPGGGIGAEHAGIGVKGMENGFGLSPAVVAAKVVSSPPDLLRRWLRPGRGPFRSIALALNPKTLTGTPSFTSTPSNRRRTSICSSVTNLSPERAGTAPPS